MLLGSRKGLIFRADGVFAHAQASILVVSVYIGESYHWRIAPHPLDAKAELTQHCREFTEESESTRQ